MSRLIRIDDGHGTSAGRINVARQVALPRFVPLTSMVSHLDLRLSAKMVRAAADEARVGTAIRVRRSRRSGKVRYLATRRPRGSWSFDARRVGSRLQLVCFADVPTPGFPMKAMPE